MQNPCSPPIKPTQRQKLTEFPIQSNSPIKPFLFLIQQIQIENNKLIPGIHRLQFLTKTFNITHINSRLSPLTRVTFKVLDKLRLPLWKKENRQIFRGRELAKLHHLHNSKIMKLDKEKSQKSYKLKRNPLESSQSFQVLSTMTTSVSYWSLTFQNIKGSHPRQQLPIHQ